MTADEFHMIRRRLKLSQSALGKLLGRTRFTIARYESGYTTIPNAIKLSIQALMLDRKS